MTRQMASECQDLLGESNSAHHRFLAGGNERCKYPESNVRLIHSDNQRIRALRGYEVLEPIEKPGIRSGCASKQFNARSGSTTTNRQSH